MRASGSCRARVASSSGGRSGAPGDEGRPAGEQGRFLDPAQGVGDLAVQRAERSVAEASGAAADPVHDPSALDRERRREEAAQLEEHERGALRGDPEAAALVPDAEGGDTQLVGGAHVHPVHLAVGRDRVEVDDAWQENRRETPGPHQLDHRPEAADALGLRPVLGAHQDDEVELRLVESGDRHQRKPVARRRGDQVERARRVQPVHQRRRVSARLVGADRRLEEHLPVGEAAEVEALRPGVDADDARHGGRGQPVSLERATL